MSTTISINKKKNTIGNNNTYNFINVFNSKGGKAIKW